MPNKLTEREIRFYNFFYLLVKLGFKQGDYKGHIVYYRELQIISHLFFLGRKYKEIGKDLGISRQAVGICLKGAFRRVRPFRFCRDLHREMLQQK